MEEEKLEDFQNSHLSHAQKHFTDFLGSSPRRVTRPYGISRDVSNLEKTKPVTNILRRGSFRGRLEDIFKNVTAGKIPPAVQRLQEKVAPAGQIEQAIKNPNQFNATQQSNIPGSFIIPINDLVGIDRDKYSIGEKQARCKLASLYRVIERKGWTLEIYNHVSLRAPGAEEHFLLNAFGLSYSEITASNLVKVNLHGDIIDPGSTQLGISKAGYVIHSAIHEARKDIRCIIHLHTPQGAGVSTMICGLLPLCQEALIVGGVSYHAYRGIACDDAEKAELVRDLGPVNKAMILHNHGLLAMGSTIEEAYHTCYNLVIACETQVKALCGGLANVMMVDNEVAAKVFATVRRGGGGGVSRHSKLKIGELEYEALMRELDNLGYNTGYPYKISDLLLPGSSQGANGPHEDIPSEVQAMAVDTGQPRVTPKDNEVANIAEKIRQELKRIKQQKSKMATRSSTPPEITELGKGRTDTNHDDGTYRQIPDTNPTGVSLAHIAMESSGRTRPIYSGLNAMYGSDTAIPQQITPSIKSSVHLPNGNEYEVIQMMTPTIQGTPTGSRVPVHGPPQPPLGYLHQPTGGHTMVNSTHNDDIKGAPTGSRVPVHGPPAGYLHQPTGGHTMVNSTHNDDIKGTPTGSRVPIHGPPVGYLHQPTGGHTMVNSTHNDDVRNQSSAWDFLNERQSHGPLPLPVTVINPHQHKREGNKSATSGPSLNVPTSFSTSLQPPQHAGSGRSPHRDHRVQLASWPEEPEKQDNGSLSTKPTSTLIQEPNRALQHNHMRPSPLTTASQSVVSGSNRVDQLLPTHYIKTSSNNMDTSRMTHNGKVSFHDTKPQGSRSSVPSNTTSSAYHQYDDTVLNNSQSLPAHGDYSGHYVAPSGSYGLSSVANANNQLPSSSEPLYISSTQERADHPLAVNTVSDSGLTDLRAYQPYQLGSTIVSGYDNPLLKVEETAKAVANSTDLSVKKLSYHRQQQLLIGVASTSDGMNNGEEKVVVIQQLQNNGTRTLPVHSISDQNGLSTGGVLQQTQLLTNGRVLSNKHNGVEGISTSIGETKSDAKKNVLSNHLASNVDQGTVTSILTPPTHYSLINSHTNNNSQPSPAFPQPPSPSSHRPSPSSQPPLPLSHRPPSPSPLSPLSHQPPFTSSHPPPSPSSHRPPLPLSTTNTTYPSPSSHQTPPPALSTANTSDPSNVYLYSPPTLDLSLTGLDKATNTARIVAESTKQSVEKLSKTHKLVLDNGGVDTATGELGRRDDIDHEQPQSDDSV